MLAQLDRAKSKRKATKRVPKKLSVGEEVFFRDVKACCLDDSVEREVRVDPVRRWRWDFADLSRRLLVDIQGGTWNKGGHVRGKGYQNDAHKHNAAVMQGYRVLLFTTDDVTSGRAIGIYHAAVTLIDGGEI